MHHDWNFGFMSNTDEWKKYRRVFMSKFGPGNVHIYDPVQENASHELLQRLLEEPEAFLDHIRLCVFDFNCLKCGSHRCLDMLASSS